MNKRIRKKKDKQQLIRAITGLVEEARRMEEQRQAAIQRCAAVYVEWYEKQRAQRSY